MTDHGGDAGQRDAVGGDGAQLPLLRVAEDVDARAQLGEHVAVSLRRARCRATADDRRLDAVLAQRRRRLAQRVRLLGRRRPGGTRRVAVPGEGEHARHVETRPSGDLGQRAAPRRGRSPSGAARSRPRPAPAGSRAAGPRVPTRRPPSRSRSQTRRPERGRATGHPWRRRPTTGRRGTGPCNRCRRRSLPPSPSRPSARPRPRRAAGARCLRYLWVLACGRSASPRRRAESAIASTFACDDRFVDEQERCRAVVHQVSHAGRPTGGRCRARARRRSRCRRTPPRMRRG